MPRGPRGAGDRIVAVLDDALLAALGGRSGSVRMTAETAAKQAARHPDLAPEDYERLQTVIDHGHAILQNEKTLAFVCESADGGWFKAVVNRSGDGRETNLVTFHKCRARQLDSARRRGVPVRAGGKEKAAPGGAQRIPREAEAAGLGLGSGASATIPGIDPRPQGLFAPDRASDGAGTDREPS